MAGTTPYMGIPYKHGTDLARIAADNEAAYRVIDAQIAEIAGKLKARDGVYLAHDSDGAWSLHNGLGEPLTAHAGADGDWTVIQ